MIKPKRESIIQVLMLLILSTSPLRTGLSQQADNLEREKSRIEVELKTLAAEGSKLQPLARARAETEIADAVWAMDKSWARELLEDAYQLTLPPANQSEQKTSGQLSGRTLEVSSELDQARNYLRGRILNIASRDKALAKQFAEKNTRSLSKDDQNSIYSSLARSALESGDLAGASQNVTRTFEVDPVHGGAADVVNDLALQDRAAADALIVQFIQNLRQVSFSANDLNLQVIYLTLSQLVFPDSMFPDPNRKVPPPGPSVMRAYAYYVVEALSQLERTAPGSLRRNRSLLLSAWLPLRDFAPELTPSFIELEKQSRRPGQSASLPTQTVEEREKEWQQKRAKEALESDRPSGMAITSMINRGDFDNARKLIDKLPDGEEKAGLLEKVNTNESLSLTAKGDLYAAARLASALTRANSMLKVFPAIIKKCVDAGDRSCVTNVLQQSVKQLRAADTAPPRTPAGIPQSAVSYREFDPVVQSLGLLAQSLSRTEKDLSLDVLDEMVLSANKSNTNTELGQTGFAAETFRKLAATDEARVRQAANGLINPLQRVTAISQIYKFEVEELERRGGEKSKSGKLPNDPK